MVQSMLNNIVQTSEHKNEDQEGQQTSGSDTYDAAPVYVIIFTAADGGQTCYMLNDHILNISEQTGIAKMRTIPLLRSFALLMD